MDDTSSVASDGSTTSMSVGEWLLNTQSQLDKPVPDPPRRYSDMMTYTPATFRDLPTELRLEIWDEVTYSPRVLWHAHGCITYLETRELDWKHGRPHFVEGQKCRAKSVLLLKKLHRESRQHVRQRFLIVNIRHPSRRPSTSVALPTHYVLDTKLDVFDLDPYPVLPNTSLVVSCLRNIGSIKIEHDLLKRFLSDLDSGIFEFPMLKKIYVKLSGDLDIERIRPALRSGPAKHERYWARVIVGWEQCYDYAVQSQAEEDRREEGLCFTQYISEDYGLAEIDRMFLGWEQLEEGSAKRRVAMRWSTIDWSILERRGLTCVFVYNTHKPTSLLVRNHFVDPYLGGAISVFSTRHGPPRRDPLAHQPDRRIREAGGEGAGEGVDNSDWFLWSDVPYSYEDHQQAWSPFAGW
ncbi:hypothetical protein EKO27_g11905 [Xylaria grammica]|uniref:Uncharacterized protein n=1 Tax=Xylaria grammica TaxID=363999 RepID=A0A439CM06_9PEZI|nr:hypothetical protein EKO27_g11905 [Xylaria grammica]